MIDPVSSKYVRRIFDLALEGMGASQITLRLNEEHVPTAGRYNLENTRWSLVDYKAPDSEQLWNRQKVWKILKRYEYTGALVMGKRRRYILGNRSTRRIPEKDWIIVEGAHEPIITQEEFREAQGVIRGMKKKEYRRSPRPVRLFPKIVMGNTSAV